MLSSISWKLILLVGLTLHKSNKITEKYTQVHEHQKLYVHTLVKRGRGQEGNLKNHAVITPGNLLPEYLYTTKPPKEVSYLIGLNCNDHVD